MRVRVKDIEVRVDLVQSAVDVGQLAALAPKLGWTAFVEPDWDSEFEVNGRPSGARVNFERADPDYPGWCVDELTHLAMVYGYAYQKSGNQIVADLQAELVERGFPMEAALQDTFAVGEASQRDDDEDG